MCFAEIVIPPPSASSGSGLRGMPSPKYQVLTTAFLRCGRQGTEFFRNNLYTLLAVIGQRQICRARAAEPEMFYSLDAPGFGFCRISRLRRVFDHKNFAFAQVNQRGRTRGVGAF